MKIFFAFTNDYMTDALYQNFSLFTSYPEFQRKHFPHMMNSSIGKSLTKKKLQIHGKRVIHEISVMVECVQEGNDAELMAKIKQVGIDHENNCTL